MEQLSPLEALKNSDASMIRKLSEKFGHREIKELAVNFGVWHSADAPLPRQQLINMLISVDRDVLIQYMSGARINLLQDNPLSVEHKNALQRQLIEKYGSTQEMFAGFLQSTGIEPAFFEKHLQTGPRKFAAREIVEQMNRIGSSTEEIFARLGCTVPTDLSPDLAEAVPVLQGAQMNMLDKLKARFTIEEMFQLCFERGIPYEDLKDLGKGDIFRELMMQNENILQYALAVRPILLEPLGSMEGQQSIVTALFAKFKASSNRVLLMNDLANLGVDLTEIHDLGSNISLSDRTRLIVEYCRRRDLVDALITKLDLQTHS